MQLVDLVPEFNLYEEYWKIYTQYENITPQYIADSTKIERSIIGEGAEIYGEVYNSVLGAGVVIGKGTVVRDSIIMQSTVVGEDCTIERSIIAEKCVIGDRVRMGQGEEAPSTLNESVYAFGLVTIGDDSVIPSDVSIGKNTAIKGVTVASEYVNGALPAGGYIVKEGELV